MHINVLRVVDLSMAASLDPMYHAGLKVKKDGARDVACIVGLIEKDIFAVTTLSGIGL